VANEFIFFALVNQLLSWLKLKDRLTVMLHLLKKNHEANSIVINAKRTSKEKLVNN